MAAAVQQQGLAATIQQEAHKRGQITQAEADAIGRYYVTAQANKLLDDSPYFRLAAFASESRPQRVRLFTLTFVDAVLRECGAGNAKGAASTRFSIAAALLDEDEDTLKKSVRRFDKAMATADFPFRRRRR